MKAASPIEVIKNKKQCFQFDAHFGFACPFYACPIGIKTERLKY